MHNQGRRASCSAPIKGNALKGLVLSDPNCSIPKPEATCCLVFEMSHPGGFMKPGLEALLESVDLLPTGSQPVTSSRADVINQAKKQWKEAPN